MKNLKNHGLALFTILIWGITFISTKHLENTFSALEILFVRYFIAYIVLWIIYPKFQKIKSVKHELYIFIAAMSGATIYQYLENLSVSFTSPASVSFITATAPIFTAILANKFLNERLNKKIILGMLVSVIGVFFICFGDSIKIETGLLGDMIIFLSVWLWAIYSVVVKKIASFGYHQFAVTRRLFFYALIVMIPFMIFTGDGFEYQALLRADSILNFMFLGVMASAICFATWNISVDRLGATTTSKYLFIMPVITLIAQAIYNKNDIGYTALIGMAVTLLGIGISEFDINRLLKSKRR